MRIKIFVVQAASATVCTGNTASATKIETTRTINGYQSFNYGFKMKTRKT